MHGGGYSTYCSICDMPFGDYEKKQLNWFVQGMAFDRGTGLVFEVNRDDNNGGLYISQGEHKGKKVCWEKYHETIDAECPFVGLMCHADCVNFVGSVLGRGVTLQDVDRIVMRKIEDRHDRGLYYGGWSQHYKFEEALEKEGHKYFYSPADPKGEKARSRIQQWISQDAMPSAFASSSARRKSRKNSRKTRRNV